ncbi:MAG: HAD-IB family hydrolase [Myxococcales bacterium]|jgi:HAD superfamily hydrolase (TIGR01490 family)
MGRRVAAFFDLDRTLLEVNSAGLWAKHELFGGNISARQFARVVVWNALYHLSLIDIETAFREAVAHYRGRLYRDLEDETRRWFAREVAHRIRPGARVALREHRERGHELVLLTSASAFEARAAKDTWSLHDYLSNDFPTDENGKLVGTFVPPLCYGAGKVRRATNWASERGIDLASCYFYSDSLTDLPMLRAVGHPRVVSPDPRLKRTAQRMGWPILRW